MARCKVHPESPLPGAPAAGTPGSVRARPSPPRALPGPSVAGRPRPGARQPPAPSARTGAAPRPRRDFFPAPLPQAARRPPPPPPPGRAVWMLAGWGREAPRRSRDSRVRPCPGCFLNGEVGECGGGWKKEGRQQLRRQVKVGYPSEGKGPARDGGEACRFLPARPALCPGAPSVPAPGLCPAHGSLISRCELAGGRATAGEGLPTRPSSRGALTSFHRQGNEPALPSPIVYSWPLPH